MRKVLTLLSLSLVAYGTAAMAQPTLKTEQDKTLYALGLAIGQNVQGFKLTEPELAMVAAGFGDAALHKDAKVDLDTYQPKIQELAQQRMTAAAGEEKKASQAFLDKMAMEKGAEKSASGVVYIPVTVGTGATPKETDTVKVHYHGTLRDGTVFDSSVQRGQPVSFPLNGVIPCWTEGVQKMKVGGKAKLVCPSDTAYGDSGRGPIPGGAALLFEVELLSIEQPEQ